MAITIPTASKAALKLRIGITGPSGAGKTLSSLLLARGIASAWDKIAVLCTENGSSNLYADIGPYGVWNFRDQDNCRAVGITPDDFKNRLFCPDNYIKHLRALEDAGMEVIIVDSLTHAWAAEGGILSQSDQMKLAQRGGNSYTNWASLTPQQDALVAALIKSPCHIIGTMRSKQDYILVQNAQGKQVPQKVGMAPVQRDDLQYEFDLVFDVDAAHMAVASKDRTQLFDGQAPFMLSEETGKTLLAWANTTDATAVQRAEDQKQVKALQEEIKGLIATNKEALAVHSASIKAAYSVCGNDLSKLIELRRSISMLLSGAKEGGAA